MNTEAEKPKPLRIVIPLARLSYPQVWVAKAMKGGKPKFSVVALMDKKEHAASIKQIQAMIQRATLDKFGKAMTFKPDNVCLHDGSEKEEKEGYGDGVMYLVAKCDTRPEVVDEKMVRINPDDGKIYGGCYADVSVEIYAYEFKEDGKVVSKGVSASLRALRFRKDGESFGGGGPIRAEDEFEALEESVENY